LLAGGAAVWIAARRDLDASLAPRHAATRSRDRLLGSTSRLAVRTELPTLVVWVVAAGTFAAILGAFAKSIARSSTVADSSPARQSLCCDTSLLRGPCDRVRSAYPTVS
jgi:putative exporter of polyketide antibiotics